jgi:hypothetical protein
LSDLELQRDEIDLPLMEGNASRAACFSASTSSSTNGLWGWLRGVLGMNRAGIAPGLEDAADRRTHPTAPGGASWCPKHCSSAGQASE